MDHAGCGLRKYGAVIQARLLWAVLPQFIGWFIGFMVAMSILGIRA